MGQRFRAPPHESINMANIYQLQTPTLIEFTGRDRSKVINNLTTQDFRNIQDLQASETFVTDGKGKTVGHGIAASIGDRIYFLTVADQGARLVPHFDRFIIMEDAAVREVTDQFQYYLSPNLDQLKQSRLWQTLVEGSTDDLASLPQLKLYRALTNQKEADVAHKQWPQGAFHFNLDAGQVILLSAPWIGPEALILIISKEIASSESVSQINIDIWKLDDRKCWEFQRISANWPWFGVDFDEKNLPQEIDRNQQAISFTKGCYFGQETIARLDALGQVQKKLVRLKVRDSQGLDISGLTTNSLQSDGVEVGTIRSLASESNSSETESIGFGFVKRSHFGEGTELSIANTELVARIFK